LVLGLEAGLQARRDRHAVTSEDLAKSYLVKARARLKALAVLRDEGAHSDVVREAQELVELALKAMLRSVGVEPPKIHDVSTLLLEHRVRFVPDVGERLGRAAEISQRLRHDRELAFYGDIDFIPTEQYSRADAARAFEQAAWILRLAEDAIRRGRP
jgi:HEPN domain-containing protein